MAQFIFLNTKSYISPHIQFFFWWGGACLGVIKAPKIYELPLKSRESRAEAKVTSPYGLQVISKRAPTVAKVFIYLFCIVHLFSQNAPGPLP